MKINFLPKTKPGKWSCALVVGFFAIILILRILNNLAIQRDPTFFRNPIFDILGLLTAICGISAFFTGIIGIIRKKERAILVFLTALFGLFVLLFVLGEIISPH